MSNVVEFDNVSIIFGAKPEKALPMMDEGRERAEIQSTTGQVLGVHNCSLNVGEGEILVLMGLSGSGKSTLLRAANGLNKVTRGHVRVNNGEELVDITNLSPANLRQIRQQRVTMVFQQFGLLPWRSVRDNVGFGLEISGVAADKIKERVDKQIELVGLSGWSHRNIRRTLWWNAATCWVSTGLCNASSYSLNG